MQQETHPLGAPADSPVDADAPTEDRIGTAVRAMATGAVATVAWFAFLTWIQSTMVRDSTVRDVSQVDPRSLDVNFLVYGSLAGMAFGAVVAWALMYVIPSSYRRGGLALVAAFGGTVVGGMATYAGRAGGPGVLLGIGAASTLLALWLARRTIASVR